MPQYPFGRAVLWFAPCVATLIFSCAHRTRQNDVETLEAARVAEAQQALKVPFSQLKGRAVVLLVLDRRTAGLEDSQALRELTRTIVTQLVTRGGAAVSDEAPDRVELSIDRFQTLENGPSDVGCAKFTGRFVKKGQEFLPTETSSERCITEGAGNNELPADVQSYVLALTRRVPNIAKHPGLGRAYGVALSELLNRLDRQAR